MLSNVANPVFHFEFNKKPCLLLLMDQYFIIILKLKYTIPFVYYIINFSLVLRIFLGNFLNRSVRIIEYFL